MKEFKNIKKDLKYVAFCVVLFCLVYALVIIDREYKFADLFSNAYAIITLVVLVVYSIVYFFVCRNIDRKEVKWHNLFIAIAIPIGLLYSLANPLGIVPDERIHIIRSYEVSKGIWISDTDEEGNAIVELDVALSKICSRDNNNYEEYFDMLFSQEETENMQYDYYNGTAFYSPICYFPQAICIFITRALGLNISVQVIAARMGNFLFAMFLVYFAIKKIPFKKLIVLLIACLPIAFNEFASLSPDALINSITLFFVAYIMYVSFDKNKQDINKKDYIILTLSSILLSMVKIVYLPFCLMLFVIPNDKFASKKEKFLKLGGIFAISVILNLIWLKIGSRFLIEFNEGVNSKEQMKFILMHPINYIFVILRTLNTYFQYMFMGLFGDDLSCLNVDISAVFKIPFIIMMIMIFICQEEKEAHIDLKTKIISFIIVIGVTLLTCTSLYIQWTALQNGIVEGLQPRYLIPLLLPLALVINNHKFEIKTKLNYRYIIMFVIFLNLHSVMCIMNLYMQQW